MTYCTWCIIKVISLMDPHESDVTPIIIYSFEKSSLYNYSKVCNES